MNIGLINHVVIQRTDHLSCLSQGAVSLFEKENGLFAISGLRGLNFTAKSSSPVSVSSWVGSCYTYSFLLGKLVRYFVIAPACEMRSRVAKGGIAGLGKVLAQSRTGFSVPWTLKLLIVQRNDHLCGHWRLATTRRAMFEEWGRQQAVF